MKTAVTMKSTAVNPVFKGLSDEEVGVTTEFGL